MWSIPAGKRAVCFYISAAVLLILLLMQKVLSG